MSNAEHAQVLPLDGRHRRRVENSDAAVRAMSELFEETGGLPTVAEVAERAGISPRSVFRYFEDVDALARAAVDARFREAAAHAVLPTMPADLDSRIDLLTATRADLYDFVGPTARLVRNRLADHPIVIETVSRSRTLLRLQIQQVFAPELDDLGAESGTVLDVLDVLFSLETWGLLTESQGHRVDEARRTLATASRRILGR
jgi:AcrR family transcriptional regulator